MAAGNPHYSAARSIPKELRKFAQLIRDDEWLTRMMIPRDPD
jgi:hypothetical protein